MNKKILSLVFIFGLVAIPVQSAAFNDELNAVFARRAAARQAAEDRRDAVPQADINVDPVPVHPAPVVAEGVINVDPAPVDNPIPQAYVNVDPVPVHPAPVVAEEIIDVDPVPVVEAEEVITQQPVQTGALRKFLGGIFRYGASIVNNTAAENIFICNICKDDISSTATDNQKLEQTPCKHNFHLGCLEEHKTMVGETCPECEEDIKKVPIHECPICIEDILDEDDTGKKMVGTPCQHFFHTNCLALACQAAIEAGGQAVCPLCRTALNTVAAPIERAAATDQQIRNIEQTYERQIDALRDQIAQIEGENRNNNGNRLPEGNIPHQIPVPADQGENTTLSTSKAIALVATGAATASFIPGASKVIKSGLTAATNKACKVVCKHPKEITGIVAVAALGCCVARGTNTREVIKFAKNHADGAIIVASGLTLAGMIAANK